MSCPYLFVPRKGLEHYTPDDLEINWCAIERWAFAQNEPIIFPKRFQERMPSADELDIDWRRMELWGIEHSLTAPLVIDKLHSLSPDALTTNFLSIQNWGNTHCGHPTT